MTIVSRITQYGSLVSSGEFNEIGQSKVGIGTTNIVAYEFNENILEIVTSGLVMNLDAANNKSYPGIGITWTDLSGKGNNGTLTLGPTYSSANGGSIVFDGIDDRVIATRPSSIVTGGSISVSVWAKWITTGTTIDAIQVLVDNNHSSSPIQGFVLQDRPDLSKSIQFGTQFDSNGAVSTFQVGDGTWHHIVGTNDTVTSKLYIDGILNNSAPQGGLATVQPNISIGYWQFTPGRQLNGNISQVSIYDRALSASEVLQNYDALKGRFGTFPTNALTANGFSPYDLIYSEFVDVLYGTGGGTYVRQKADQSLVVYDEINELDLVPTVVLTPSTTSLNEGTSINFAIATTNVEDGIPLYYEILTPSPTAKLTQSVTSVQSGRSVSFNASTVNIDSGTTLSYEIIGSVSSSDFTDNSLTGITTVTGGIIDTITKTTTGDGNKSFVLSLIDGGNALATSSAVTITPPSLYSFTSATFTPGGQTGLTGPNLAQAISGLTGTGVDAWKNNTAFFNTTNGVQLWTVPITGVYSIQCFGAQGADDVRIVVAGGLGAVVRGNFVLTKGDQYSIVVGQRGITQTNGWGGGGGGGGTFVWKTGVTSQPVIVAGGGGCGGQSSIGQQGGQITTSGGAGSNSGGAGGTNGAASQSSGICGGGGGRGWLGGPSHDCGVDFTYTATYIDATGRDTGQGGVGGFGGGGGSYGGGGGGGGYSGGGAGGWSNSGCGGGGGSYNTGATQTNTPGVRSGPGEVTIALIQAL